VKTHLPDLRIASVFLVGAVLALGPRQVSAEARPVLVPSFRAYGMVTISGALAPPGTPITAVSASPPNPTCGSGTVSGNGSYFVDIDSVPGCLGDMTFRVNNQPASNPATVPPALQGSPVRVNIEVPVLTAPSPSSSENLIRPSPPDTTLTPPPSSANVIRLSPPDSADVPGP
jgi:hypothetical protein